MTAGLVALDLFAGVGWGVACQAMGIREKGVDNAPAVVTTRGHTHMETVYRNVWHGLLGDDPIVIAHDLQIASPPCQTFSAAGSGAGRAVLERVLRLVDERAYERPADLRAFGDETDPRTALVLTPLAHVWRDRPEYVVWEQVPPVLPVWERAATDMRTMGYSAWTGVLHAEQFGVPQTRRRAFLIARRDGGEARPPAPTHSRYYPRDPRRFDDGVLPWVSMAEALGWGMSERPSPTITGGGTETGGAEPIAKLARYISRPDWTFRRPATTIVANPRLGGPGRSEFVKGGVSRQNQPGGMRLEAHEAAALQTFPADFPFQGGKGDCFLQIGNAVPPLLGQRVLEAVLS